MKPVEENIMTLVINFRVFRVYANWFADGSNKLGWFQIGTQEEPLGEGFTDIQV